MSCVKFLSFCVNAKAVVSSICANLTSASASEPASISSAAFR